MIMKCEVYILRCKGCFEAMNITNKIKQCLPFSFSQSNSGKVTKDEIKSVVVERFIQTQDCGHISSKCSSAIRSRLTKNLFDKRSYTLNDQNQKPTNGDIFNWFISSEYGSKLHRRSIVKQDEALEAFLRVAGVDINCHDEHTGDTPLILAARNHHSQVVKTLIEHGADVSAKNFREHDAIREVVRSMNDSNYRSKSLHATTEYLIASGANISQSIHGPLKTLSGYAITKSQFCTATLFITPHPRTFEDSTVFALAQSNKPDSPKIIDCIYKNFPDIDRNAKDENGMTALMLASHSQNPACLKALLKQPQTNKEETVIRLVNGFEKYHTAYSFSARKSGSECARILAEAGAQKIFPKLTGEEQMWLAEYQAASAKLEEAKKFPAEGYIPGFGILFVVFSAMDVDALEAKVEKIVARQPKSQLRTPPEE